MNPSRRALMQAMAGAALACLKPVVSMAQLQSPPASTDKRIVMTVGPHAFVVVLADTEAARAFAHMLPASFEMSDLNRNEKKVRLPRPLPTTIVQPGIIHAGDVMLWGEDTLVVFYETFQSPYRYTRIGRIEQPHGLAQALGAGNVRITFARP